MIGQTISHYKITAKLGEGGMGEVYLATDTTFDRPVTIKLLSSEQNADATARQRFLHEAKAQAMLNHPNVTTFLDAGEHDGRAFIVMEYVDGQPLDACVTGMKLTTAEILDLIRQIAEGLEAAHERGVIHRDIKPQNILVTSKRRVKITDFGLARWQGASTLTRTGTQMGTVHYMSPEQTEGKRVDHRADIFSLGVILYELICLRRPFEGDTATAVSYAILSSHPQPLARFSAGVPDDLQPIVDKCLAKDPEHRYQSVSDLLADIRRVLRQVEGRISGAGQAAASRTRNRLAWGVATVCLLAAFTFAALYLGSDETPAPVVRMTVDAPKGTTLENYWGALPISPDGKSVVFQATDTTSREWSLWVRPLGSLAAIRLAGTDGALFPFWSPDGRFIAFFADDKLKKIPATGGPVLAICEAKRGRGGSWGRDNVIVFSPNIFGALHRVAAAGGVSIPLAVPDTAPDGFTHRWPHFLPDGRHFLFLASSPPHSDNEAAIWVGSLDGEPAMQLVRAKSNPAYAAGYLLYLIEKTLMAHPFDAAARKLTGDAVPLAENVSYQSGSLLGMYSVGMSGDLVYLESNAGELSQVRVYNRAGQVIDSIGGPEVYSGRLCLSPNEDRLAVDITAESEDNPDIWIYDLARHIRQRLTSDSATETNPVWSPDGNRIAFRSSLAGIFKVFVKDASGIGGEKLLIESPRRCLPWDWSPDGRELAIQCVDSANNVDIGMLALDGGGEPQLFMPTDFTEADARFSPDGIWVAYTSMESGSPEVYVARRREPARRWQISTDGGYLPSWRGDGKEVFYVIGVPYRTMAVEVDGTGDAFRVGEVRPFFRIAPRVAYGCDVSRDGQRLYTTSSVGEPTEPTLTLVLNWPAELAKK